MTIEATHDHQLMPASPAGPAIHPVWVRVTHWVNAVAVVIMIGSGWEIYNASPLFAFAFPPAITLGGWLAGALLWHCPCAKTRRECTCRQTRSGLRGSRRCESGRGSVVDRSGSISSMPAAS